MRRLLVFVGLGLGVSLAGCVDPQVVDADAGEPPGFLTADVAWDGSPPLGQPEVSPDVPSPEDCSVDLDCEATHPCRVGRCNPVDGTCFEEPVALAKDCDDGDPCLSASTCQEGFCAGGQEVDCDDANPCTNDSCLTQVGCLHEPIDGCCEPNCEGKACGLDGCGGICGACEAGESCVEPGVCVSECMPDCAGKVCGSDGCGSFCGQCGVGDMCDPDGQCVDACAPDCIGKSCGPDGCAGSCGACVGAQFCDAGGECQMPCTGDCTGKSCGDDGCGQSCGSCNAGATCTPGGQCLDTSAGNTCADAIEVTQFPVWLDGDTSTATNDTFFADGECPGEASGLGGASNDRFYAFKPPVAGNYKVSLSTNFDAVLYVASDCQDVPGTCLGAADVAFIANPEELVLFFPANSFTTIVVDGYSNWSDASGTFTLAITKFDNGGCTPSCSGKECGPNGCGAFCGVCSSASESCGPTGQCGDPDVGQSCEDPVNVASIPFVAEATTEGASNLYEFGYGECPGTSSGAGNKSGDHVYAITPTSTGNYQVTLENAYDASVYLVTDCGDVDGSCVMGAEEVGTWAAEEFVAFLESWNTYYLIVDGGATVVKYEGSYTLTVEPYKKPGCTPDCVAKNCGDDGCGGLCGVCGSGTTCDAAGQCAVTGTGSTCENPYTMSLGKVLTGDTSQATNDYHFNSNACPGVSYGCGKGGKDEVASFKPIQGGTYTFELESNAFDAVLYVTTDCGTLSQSCLGASDTVGMETLDVMLEPLQTVYVIVDGYSNVFQQSGSYTLTVTGPN